MPLLNPGDWPIDPNVVDGTELAARLNRLQQALVSGSANPTRPPYITAGGTWIRDNGAAATPRYELMIFDGTADIKAGGSSFPSGTRMLFQQTAAPTGWTKVTTVNDVALRVVSGSVGSGGNAPFSAVFAGRNVDGHTLTVAEMPLHGHRAVDPGHSHGVTDPQHHHSLWTMRDANTGMAGGAVMGFQQRVDQGAWGGITDNPTGISIQGSGTNVTIAGEGGNQPHLHSINMFVNYVDVILATKD